MTSTGPKDSPSPRQPSERFATTRWSMVRAAGTDDSPESREALEDLCLAYWHPLYGYVRRSGHAAAQAQDLTQGFILSLLTRDAIGTADPDRGRFRSFLLGSLNKFLVDQHRYENAQKRGGGLHTFSIDAEKAEQRYLNEPVEKLTPEKIFQRQWALTMLDRAQSRLRQTYTDSNQSALFEQLLPHLSRDQERLPYREIAAALNMKEGAIKVAAHRLKQRYREALRYEILQTLDSPDELDDELRQLFSYLQPPE